MGFRPNMISRAKRIFTPSQPKVKVVNGGNPFGELDSSSKALDSRFSTDNTMGFRPNIISRAKRIFTPSQPKVKVVNGGNPFGELDSSSKALDSRFSTGSKEDVFFDSRALIDSDCEDDFFNASGDFTPSQGSTPNHQTSTTVRPQLNLSLVDIFPDVRSETSPTERKKNLSDFLQENVPGEATNMQKDVAATVGNNGNIEVGNKKEKIRKHRHCCLSSLIHSRSMSDWRKQKASPDA